MAEKQQNLRFQNPYTQLQDVLPDQVSNADAMAAAYQRAYDQHNFGVSHPVASGIIGLLTGGPQGALQATLGARQADQQRQVNLYKQYQDWSNNQIESQKNINEIRKGYAPGQVVNNVFDSSNIQSPVPKNALISDVLAQTLLNGMTNPDQQTSNLETLDRVRHNNYNWVGNQSSVPQAYGQPQNQTLPPMPDAQTLTGGVNISAEVPPPPKQAYTYSNPDITKQLLIEATSAGNTGLTQGQDRYQFDQQAPDRLAERGLKTAQTGKTRAETVTEGKKPAYYQALTGQANRSGGSAGRAPGEFETIWNNATPEQRMQIIANKANGSAGDGTGYNKGEQQQYNMLKDQATLASQIFGKDSQQAKDALSKFQRFDLRSQVGGDMSNVRRPARNTAAYKPSPMLPSTGGFQTQDGTVVKGLGRKRG
jgi:hypothetical protein